MPRISREDFLQVLESVEAGLSVKEVLEQSRCFVFKRGKVYTFNDETFCSSPSLLPKDWECAIPSPNLLGIIKRLKEDELEVFKKDGKVCFQGKGRKSKFIMQEEILLPVDSVEIPEEWQKLHDDFSDAVALVQTCAGDKSDDFVFTCVHIHPNWIEAGDKYQFTRYRLPTGVKEPLLVKKESITYLSSLGMTEMGETPSWIHFKNPLGLTYSCRKFVEDYPDLTINLKGKGKEVRLSKGLQEASEVAEIFSQENKDNNVVKVILKPGIITVIGEGYSGTYQEKRRIKYDGERVSFCISPKILAELCKKHNACEIGDRKLFIRGEKWKYSTILGEEES